MKKLSLILIAILLSSMAPLFSSYSQPNACINTNTIKTPELEAQFEAWLNEPNGLNDRFIAGIESSQERGERLFYNLVLNNNQVCLSDLTQEMISSITWVINSYNNATDYSYQIGSFTVSRSQINLGFKAIRDPIVLGRPSIFAEALQFARPGGPADLTEGNMLDSTSTVCVGLSTTCFAFVDEVIRDDSDYVKSISNPPIGTQINWNLTDVTDPITHDGWFYNYTYGKDSSAGKQIDFQIIYSDNINVSNQCIGGVATTHTDIGVSWIQNNVELTSGEASGFTIFAEFCFGISFLAVGGGAGREGQSSWLQAGFPDLTIPENEQPLIANPTLWGLFNTTSTEYSILSLNGRDKIFQDMQVRLNLTVTDLDGRNNIIEVHANFNSTIFVLSFYNDSGVFVFNTTTPLMVENLEGITEDITNGFNITFVFSLSSQLPNGYYWLSNANVTDGNSNSTLSIERWFSFIGIGAGGGGLTQLSLSPIGPQIMLALILLGMFALSQNNPWFVLSGWLSMIIALGMALSGQPYVGLDSNSNFLSFTQIFPQEFNTWVIRFLVAMMFVYPLRMISLVWERLISVALNIKERLNS